MGRVEFDVERGEVALSGWPGYNRLGQRLGRKRGMKIPPWRTPTPRLSRRKPPSPGRLLLYGVLVILFILSAILIYKGWLAL